MATRVTLRMKPDEARRAGEQAGVLLKKDQARLQERLEPGVIAGLAEDTATLSDKTSSALAARAQKTAATQRQNVTAKRIRTQVMALARWGSTALTSQGPSLPQPSTAA